MLQAVINGNSFRFEIPCTVLEALRAIELSVPTFCFDKRFPAPASCRLCLVAIDGLRKPVLACTTQLQDGMSVRTHTPELESYRRQMLETILDEHPNSALIWAAEREFHHYVRQYGLGDRLFQKPPAPTDLSHPYIAVDPTQCILCYRCVHICEDLQGQFVWQIAGRGADSSLVHAGPNFRESPCVACGACVDTCPTGALQDRSVLQYGGAHRWTRTVCPYCAVGCEIEAHSATIIWCRSSRRWTRQSTKGISA
jgi:formate dehydrogenase major subunit